MTDDCIKVAVIGQPNVGKSSPGQPHRWARSAVIVANIAGTTRDAIDTVVDNEHGKFVFIDTAGLRRKSQVDERHRALQRPAQPGRPWSAADVCVIMIDATGGLHRAGQQGRRATPTSRARPASSRSTSGTRWKRTTTPWTPCAKS